jgi:peptidoglycan LD-endopeptidase CwlK
MDSISETRLQLVWPVLAYKIHIMFDMLVEEAIYIRVVQGLRSWKDQDTLYAQGRTAPGEIVTNVKGGESYHNFGLAVDCVPSEFNPDQPYNPDWNPTHPKWQRMETVGQSLGLTVGAKFRTFPDAPHFQLTGQFPVDEPNGEVQQLWKESGMEGLWNQIKV